MNNNRFPAIGGELPIYQIDDRKACMPGLWQQLSKHPRATPLPPFGHPPRPVS